MADNREEEIRRRAHEIWEREGRPDGKESQHWEQAARELDGGGHDSSMNRTPEGSKTERVADDPQSGKQSRRG